MARRAGQSVIRSWPGMREWVRAEREARRAEMLAWLWTVAALLGLALAFVGASWLLTR